MVREIIKPVFSRPGELRVLYPRKTSSLTTDLSLYSKVQDESVVSLCGESCSASTGSLRLSGPKWFHHWTFSTCACNRQLADSLGGETEDSWANGLWFKSAPLWSLCYYFFFSHWGLRKILSLSDVKWWRKYRIVLTACGMYVVIWESSIIDMRIWDKVIYSLLSRAAISK